MITLTREAAEAIDTDTAIVWPLRVTATISGSDLPPEIFVYHCGMTAYPENDVFECIASIVQIEQLPTTRPTGDNLLIQPYYRQASVTIYCANAQQASDVWEELKIEADILASEWVRAQELSVIDTYSTL